MKYTKTSKFILPIVKWEGSFQRLVSHGFINAYIGYYHEEGTQWGRHIYLLFRKMPKHLMRELAEKNNLVNSHFTTEGVLLQFSIDEQIRESVVKPFLEGKYSEVDRDFVAENHPVYSVYPTLTDNGELSFTYRVFIRCKQLRQDIINEFGVPLEENAEVFSSPDKEEEIFQFQKILSDVIEKNLQTVGN